MLSWNEYQNAAFMLTFLTQTNRDYAIFGTGKVAGQLLDMIAQFRFKAPTFALNSSAVEGATFRGLPVIAPQNRDKMAVAPKTIILATNAFQSQMKSELKKFGDCPELLDLSTMTAAKTLMPPIYPPADSGMSKARKEVISLVDEELTRIDREINDTWSIDDLLARLRCLGLDDFGLLMFSMPNPAYPKISKLLPRMASEDVQKQWTGNTGINLLRKSLDFVHSVNHNFFKRAGESLEGKRILDYGCGYGRIIRLMYYFTSPKTIFGVDPLAKSIEICGEDGLKDNLFVSDYIPVSLPTGEMRFSLIYAFSVFTHLTEQEAQAALAALLRALEKDGLLVITIRPVEYWNFAQQALAQGVVEEQISRHNRHGFAFLANKREPVDGDTTITLRWIQQSFPKARVVGIDRSLDDPYQIYVFIRRAE